MNEKNKSYCLCQIDLGHPVYKKVGRNKLRLFSIKSMTFFFVLVQYFFTQQNM